MALDRAAILKKVAAAQVSGGGNNIRDGRGQLVVKRIALESGYNGSRFVVEFAVVSSAKVPVQSEKTGESLDVEPNPPGSDVSWVQMLDKHESAFGNIKGFVLSLFGEEDASEAELLETLEEVTGDPGACAGRVIGYETYRRITKGKGMEIVLVRWQHVEQTQADIDAMKGWLTQLAGAAAPQA